MADLKQAITTEDAAAPLDPAQRASQMLELMVRRVPLPLIAKVFGVPEGQAQQEMDTALEQVAGAPLRTAETRFVYEWLRGEALDALAGEGATPEIKLRAVRVAAEIQKRLDGQLGSAGPVDAQLALAKRQLEGAFKNVGRSLDVWLRAKTSP